MPPFIAIGNCPNGDRPDLAVQSLMRPGNEGKYVRLIPCDLAVYTLRPLITARGTIADSPS
jgi:hypothetical protein